MGDRADCDAAARALGRSCPEEFARQERSTCDAISLVWPDSGADTNREVAGPEPPIDWALDCKRPWRVRPTLSQL